MAGLLVPLSNASPAASRSPAHDSGSGWFATSYQCGAFIRDSMPIYPGAFRMSPSAPQRYPPSTVGCEPHGRCGRHHHKFINASRNCTVRTSSSNWRLRRSKNVDASCALEKPADLGPSRPTPRPSYVSRRPDRPAGAPAAWRPRSPAEQRRKPITPGTHKLLRALADALDLRGPPRSHRPENVHPFWTYPSRDAYPNTPTNRQCLSPLDRSSLSTTWPSEPEGLFELIREARPVTTHDGHPRGGPEELPGEQPCVKDR
jgi:hypothetical protein